jgi:hypothetical protein
MKLIDAGTHTIASAAVLAGQYRRQPESGDSRNEVCPGGHGWLRQPSLAQTIYFHCRDHRLFTIPRLNVPLPSASLPQSCGNMLQRV